MVRRKKGKNKYIAIQLDALIKREQTLLKKKCKNVKDKKKITYLQASKSLCVRVKK